MYKRQVYGTGLSADSVTGGLQSGAANTANQIAQDNNSPWQALIGAAGSVAGAAAGNPALFSGGGGTATPWAPSGYLSQTGNSVSLGTDDQLGNVGFSQTPLTPAPGF